uniref:CID domain-containing protein n=1 Tax=Setaria digitata TaxID=48799 RepID=A0A915PXY4_9BILA
MVGPICRVGYVQQLGFDHGEQCLLLIVMAKNAEEAALEYRQALDDLKDNNKMQINLMTILADDYNSFSKEIVTVIAQQIMKVIPPQKLAVMYVMDSILKNVTGAGNYKEHIEKIVYKVFLHVFETGDERTRLALHKLRQTWTGIFQRSTLYKIDLAVNAIDPAWPIVTPQPINTPVPGHRPQSVVLASQQPRAAAKVHVNPHFLQKNSVTATSATTTTATATTTTATSATVDNKLAMFWVDVSSLGINYMYRCIAVPTSIQQQRGRGLQLEARGLDPRLMKHDGAAVSRPVPLVTARPETVVVKQEPVDSSDVDERLNSQQAVNLMDSTGTRGFGHRKEQEFGGRSPNDIKRKSPPCVSDLETVEKKPRIRTPPQDRDRRTDSPSTSSSIIRPTNDLGSHAFITTARRAQAASSTNPIAAPHAPVIVPVSGPVILPAIPSTSGPLPFLPPIMPTVPLPLPVPNMASILAGPPIVPASANAQDLARADPNHIPPVINNETPKLEGIPANNRIFVDGRAYEVSYINDVPVIERNGLPHRIYFTGVPRNVIIDGVAYQLAFGEEKRVIIDGEEHVLRFGAPSRELYMGTYPFKGAFGGPPIFATINGVRHEIRLGGPPPEVKIEPDPCYELLRYMPRTGVDGSNRTTAPSGNEAQATVDVKGLLAKLQRTGILSALNANNRRDDTGGDSPNRSVTPPIPSEHRGEVTERLPRPPTDLKSFSMRALRIRYASVVESLHQKRRLCPNCGLRFSELKGERYQQHLDWHFRENLRSSESSRCRDWYLPIDEWYEFSEQEELTASTSAARPAGGGADDAAKDTNRGTYSVPSDSVPSKECGVCKEKFEEYWDEDDDIWKLRDCMLGQDGRIFHPGCILDASAIRMPEEDSPSEEEQSDKLSFLKSLKLKKDFSSVDS